MSKKLIFGGLGLLAFVATLVYAHTNTTITSRSRLDWPDLGYEGGAGLHAKMLETIDELGDQANSRYEEYTAVSNSTTVEQYHNFGVGLEELTVLIYTGSGIALVRVQDPVASGWGINAKAGSLKEIIEIVTPASGGPHTFAAVVIHGSAIESIDDLDDVDISSTAPEEGQALVWDSGGSEFIPGASGDSSLKLQDISGTDLIIKSGHLILSDGKELRLSADLTYDLSGYGVDDDYYVYIDTTLLPVSTTTVNGRQTYDLTSAMILLDTTLPENNDLMRYVPIGSIQRSAGTWQNQATLAVRRHDTLIGTNSSVVYSSNYPTIGEVGIVDNTQGDLVDSFLTGTYAFFNLHTDGDNGEGTAAYDLTAIGSPPFDSLDIFKSGNTLRLDGSTQYLYSTNAFFNPGPSTDFTFGGWFKGIKPSGNQNLIGQENSATDQGFKIFIDGSGFIRCQFTNSASSVDLDISIDGGILRDDWNHIVGRYDFSATTVDIFVNGNIVSSGTLTNQRAVGTPHFSIGAIRTTPAWYFDGIVDEVFFSNDTAYTADQILGIYSRRFNGPQNQAGHVIDAASYPTHGTTAFFNLVADGDNGEGTAAYDLSDNGSPDYTAKGILGADNGAAKFDGTSDYLTTTGDSFFRFSDGDNSISAWVNLNGWDGASNQVIAAMWSTTAGLREWSLYVSGSSDKLQFIYWDGSATVGALNYPPANDFVGWHYITVTRKSNNLFMYIDGVLVDSYSDCSDMNVSGTPTFTVMSDQGGSLSKGSLDEFIFNNGYAFTQSDIDKLYSRKLTHSKNLQEDLQVWEGQVEYDGFIRPYSDYVIDKGLDDLYFDLTGQNSMSEFTFNLKSNSTVGYSIATRGFERRLTATALDSALPITHGVSGRPTDMELWVETTTPGNYEQHDPASYIVASATQLISTGTTLASVVGGSTNVHLIASKGSSAVSAPAASATDNGIVTTDAQTFAGDKTFTGAITVEGTLTAEGATVNETPWFIDANIGGVSFALGNSSFSTYTSPAEGSADLVKNTNTANVGIACNLTNEADVGDLTCTAGSETVGLVFNAPSVGHYRACVEFTHYMGLTAGQSVTATFQIIQSANNNWATFIEEGKSRIYSRGEASIKSYPINLCGTFNFATTGKKTLRLYREQGITGTPVAHDIIGDRNANYGQRDIHWTVYKMF